MKTKTKEQHEAAAVAHEQGRAAYKDCNSLADNPYTPGYRMDGTRIVDWESVANLLWKSWRHGWQDAYHDDLAHAKAYTGAWSMPDEGENHDIR